jgi:hypothetical protein
MNEQNEALIDNDYVDNKSKGCGDHKKQPNR